MTTKFLHTFILLLGCATVTTFMGVSPSKGLAALPICGTAKASSTTNLNVTTASYLNKNGLSEGTSVDIGADCAVVIAGRLQGTNNYKQVRINLPNATSGIGMVMRLNQTGTQVLSVTYLGNRIDDMEINRTTGQIVVAGDFGVALLDKTASQLVWFKAVDQGSSSPRKRVAIANDGTVAVLSNSKISTFNALGNALANWTVSSNSGWYFNDVAVDAASKSVFVTGFYNTFLPSKLPVQVPYLKTYNYSGQSKWYLWAFSGAALTGNEADSRGYRLAMGRDGYLYFQGESAGGNTVFRWQPKDLKVAAPNVMFDQYNNPYQTKSNHITYYAKLDPKTGALLKGQFLLARLSDGNGNSIRHGNITADEKGNVYVVGQTAAYIAQRSQRQIASKPVGTYAGYEGYMLVVSPDFKLRKILTVWTAQGNGSKQDSSFSGVAAGGGIAAMAGTVKAPGPLITHAAIQPLPNASVSSTSPAGFFSVWPGQ